MNSGASESFVFYRSFLDAVQEMDDPDKLATLLAICNYALYDAEPELKGSLPRAVFVMAKPNLDANKARRIAGKKGGRPKRESIGFECENHRFSKSESNEDEDVNVNEDGDKTYTAVKPPRARFIPPTMEEVEAYCAERQNGIDPASFVDFYAANGWTQGKGKKIVDWKAAVRTWERRGGGNGQASELPPKTFDPETGKWR